MFLKWQQQCNFGIHLTIKTDVRKEPSFNVLSYHYIKNNKKWMNKNYMHEELSESPGSSEWSGMIKQSFVHPLFTVITVQLHSRR